MKKRYIYYSISVIILALLIFLSLPFFTNLYFSLRGEKEFEELMVVYEKDAETSIGADSPELLWRDFRQAMLDSDFEKASLMLSLDSRERGKLVIADPNFRNNVIAAPDEISKLGSEECLSESLACKEMANYSFEYLAPAEIVEVAGKEFRLDAEKIQTEIIFIKNLSDKWQLHL